MNNEEMEAIERAKAGLNFEDLFQLKTESWTVGNIDPKYDLNGDSLFIQLKHAVQQSSIHEILIEEKSQKLFRVLIELGVRFIRGDQADPDKQTTIAQIEASYYVSYVVNNADLLKDKMALDAFALHNASYHVWPFWREFAMSQSQRMNLPKVSIPMVLFKNTSRVEK